MSEKLLPAHIQDPREQDYEYSDVTQEHISLQRETTAKVNILKGEASQKAGELVLHGVYRQPDNDEIFQLDGEKSREQTEVNSALAEIGLTNRQVLNNANVDIMLDDAQREKILRDKAKGLIDIYDLSADDVEDVDYSFKQILELRKKLRREHARLMRSDKSEYSRISENKMMIEKEIMDTERSLQVFLSTKLKDGKEVSDADFAKLVDDSILNLAA